MGKKPVMNAFNDETTQISAPGSPDLSTWLEKGMNLPLEDLVEHIRETPTGEKPLHALRGLGIVFSVGFTKLYSCEGYPQSAGIGKDRAKFDAVVERVRFHESNGEALKVKGAQLSEKLESNFNNNK